MSLLAAEQIKTDTKMRFPLCSIIHRQSYMKDFVKLSELFLVYTFVTTTADDVNITKVKKYGEKPRDQR